jgi:hypothetical protein
LRQISLFAALLAALFLQGCAFSGSPIVQSIQALMSTGGTGFAGNAIPAAPDLRLDYLRVQVWGYRRVRLCWVMWTLIRQGR